MSPQAACDQKPPRQKELAFDVNGLRLTAKAWGDPAGTPTLALHGWLDNANTFDGLAPLLPELDLVAPDFAGHGFSSHRATGVHYTSFADVQDALAIANGLGWERFNVIGHSMGASVAAELAGLFPERILRAVMVDGFALVGTDATVTKLSGFARLSAKTGLFTVTFEAPCGKKEVTVKVR